MSREAIKLDLIGGLIKPTGSIAETLKALKPMPEGFSEIGVRPISRSDKDQILLLPWR